MRTNADELVGTRVGSCTLERLLGVGGMSTVYLARQERPRRQVAVKLLRASSAPGPDAWERTLARFNHEADAAATLDHANIVPIYEFGVESSPEGEIAYIVMPYLADGSLAALLARQGPLSVPQALLYLEQAAAALDYAHHVGIVHRDVKPSNLLLHPDGRLLLADFGVARALHGLPDASLTTSGVTMGTPEYMAPEQIRGEKVGPAADIYALGVVAYALLAAHTPFEVPALAHAGALGSKDASDAQAETRAILARQLNDPPPPLRAQNPGVSPRLEEAIFWALAKAPTDRPPTAGAFVRAAREGSRSRSLSAFFSKTSGKADMLLASAFAASLPRFVTPASAPVTPVRGVENLEGVQAFMDAGDPDETPSGPDTPTIHDLPLLGGRPAPQWPSPTPNPQPKRPFSLMKLLLIAASVLLACAFLASGVSVVGYLLQNYSAASSSRSPLASATTQPTTTPEPTATVDASEILALSSTSVSLPCRSGKRPPTVSVSNTGQDTAQWTASPYGPQILVSPSSGTLDPGERQTITLYGLNFSTQDRQGTLRFTVAVGDQASAVDGPTISYTLQGCSRASTGDTQSLSAPSDGNNSSQHRRKPKQN